MSKTQDLRVALASAVTKGDFTVPPYPAVALRLQRLLAADRYQLSDVADLIRSDAALAATVLATANSAALGAGPAITDLPRAVSRLGARTVGAIAIACGVNATAVSAGALLDVKFRVWRRTMSCALVCQKLAPARSMAAEEAFLAGLLHGFGRSIAVAAIERLLRGQQPPPALSAEEWIELAEEQRGPLARALAQAWQLPSVLADAIDDKLRGVSALNDLVIDADLIAGDLVTGGVPVAPRPSEEQLLEELLSRLPAGLEAFSSAAGAASKLTTSTGSAVTKPDHALVGALRRAALPVTDRRAKSAPQLGCLAIAPKGLEVLSSMRYQECAVVRLLVGEAEANFEPWFTVVLCAAEGARYHVEFQLFSPSHDVRVQWQALYHDADGDDDRSSRHQRIALSAETPLPRAGGARSRSS